MLVIAYATHQHIHTCRATDMVSTRLILVAAVLSLAVFVSVIRAQEKWVGNSEV